MAEPRKVPFVTISSFSTSPTNPDYSKKRRRDDEAIDVTFGKDGGESDAALGSGGGGGLFGDRKAAAAEIEESKPTVRLNLPLTEPNERASAEFNYGELVHSTLTQVRREWRRAVHRMGLSCYHLSTATNCAHVTRTNAFVYSCSWFASVYIYLITIFMLNV